MVWAYVHYCGTVYGVADNYFDEEAFIAIYEAMNSLGRNRYRQPTVFLNGEALPTKYIYIPYSLSVFSQISYINPGGKFPDTN